MSPLPIALYVTACLHGTLHGAPMDLCREFQIRGPFVDVAACEAARGSGAVQEWLAGLARINLRPSARNERCGPAAAAEGDDL